MEATEETNTEATKAPQERQTQGNLLTTKVVAKNLGVSRAYVLKMIKLGKIEAVFLPSAGERRVIRIPQGEVIRLLLERGASA